MANLIFENKIAVLITWAREIDMMSEIFRHIGKDLVIIVDDFPYEEKERNAKAEKIIKTLNQLDRDFVLLSNIIGKVKYEFLFSSGLSFKNKFKFSIFTKFLYANSIGNFLDFTGISKILTKVLGRSFTCSGYISKKYDRTSVEREIGNKTIRFPKGIDVSTLNFPIDLWKDVFDIHLCHGDLDFDLIKNKFPNANCVKVGYPKYDNVESPCKAKKLIYREFDLDKTKSLIFWIPTHIKVTGEFNNNIKLWFDAVSNLQKKYNIIIRPHPKALACSDQFVSMLEESNLMFDVKHNRDLSILYQASDIVLADYGASMFSAIYMQKDVLLLNMPDDSQFVIWKKTGKYLDVEVRGEMNSIDLDQKHELCNKVDDLISSSQKGENQKMRDRFFSRNGNFMTLKDFIDDTFNSLNKG
jgi:hypothetical protein